MQKHSKITKQTKRKHITNKKNIDLFFLLTFNSIYCKKYLSKLIYNEDEKQVVELMQSSKSESEWNRNADKVKKACGGYPDFWYSAIVLSGVLGITQSTW